MEVKEILRGGQFLVKESEYDSVFTPEDFSEEQQMMKEAVKEFNEREVIAKRDRFEAKDYALTEAVMRKAGEMGFLGVSVPEAYGGLDMGFVSTMLVCEYISSGTGSFSTAFGAHTGIGTMPITLYGTEAQKQKYVPKLASGEWFGAYCLTEPGAGSDANSGKTTATLSKDGKFYNITGQKMWISNAGFCNVFIVFARIEDDQNITGFIVENDPTNGIILGEEEDTKQGVGPKYSDELDFRGDYLGTYGSPVQYDELDDIESQATALEEALGVSPTTYETPAPTYSYEGSDQKDRDQETASRESAAAQEAANRDAARGGGGDSGGGGGKIVCTMMNETYGFGSFRNKIWQKYAKDNLTREHEKGYHKLFLPLVKLSKTNIVIRKILEHIAVHRTIDIRQEARGKTHILGRVYRKVLEPICYLVGKYGKR